MSGLNLTHVPDKFLEVHNNENKKSSIKLGKEISMSHHILRLFGRNNWNELRGVLFLLTVETS